MKLEKYLVKENQRIDEAGLSKKHFNKIASILKSNNASDQLIEDFANYFQELNPNFNRDMFIKASK